MSIVGRTLSRMFRRNNKNRTPRLNRLRFGKARLLLQPLEDRQVPASLLVSDGGDTGLSTQLRQVLAVADSNGEDDTITFSANTITLAGTALSYSESFNLTLTGNGLGVTTITAPSGQRFMDISSGAATVTFQAMKITGGSVTGSGGAINFTTQTVNMDSVDLSGNSATTTGGAIALTSGTLTITNSTVTGNSAKGTLGGVAIATGAASITVSNSTISTNSAATNGGVFHFGASGFTCNFTSSTVSNNVAGGLGGVINLPSGVTTCTLGMVSSTFSGNKAGSDGGITYNFSSNANLLLTIANCTVTGNSSNITTSSTGGGAIYWFGGSSTITNSSFTNNVSLKNDGGAVWTSGPLTMSNCTFTTNSATAATGGAVRAASTATIDNCTFTGNSAGTGGGAIRNAGTMTLTNSVFSGNTAAGTIGGGAIYSSANLSASTVVFNNNRATNAAGVGGAVRLVTGTQSISFADFNANTAATVGGAIHATSGTVTVNSSTFRGNSAGTNGGAISASTTFNVNNSTLNSNTAAGTGGGGAILTTTTSTVTINNSTIYDNTASNTSISVGGGGVLRAAAGPVTLNSTIVAANKTGGGTNNVEFFNSVTTAFTLVGNNSIFGTTAGSLGAATTLSGIYQVGDPSPAALADNGGVLLPDGNKIMTMKIGPASIASDSGNNTAGFTEDQRGPTFPRVIGGVADVGAYEGVSLRPQASLTTAPDINTANNSDYTFTVTYIDNESNIDTTTINTTDVVINGAGLTNANAKSATITSNLGTTVTVDYVLAAPSGGWGSNGNVGPYSVTIAKNEVFDSDTPTAFAAGNAQIGSFKTAFAVSLVVSQKSDTVDGNFGPGQMSFREALILANTNAGYVDSITFDSTVFNAATTVTLTAGPGAITDSVVITGPAQKLTYDANKTNQQISISAGQTVTASSLHFSQFSAAAAGGFLSIGANASVTLTGMSFTNNTSSSTGGGAIAITGTGTTLTLNSDTFTTNTATTSGGAIHVGAASVTMNVSSTTFTGNTASSRGGAIGGNASGSFTVANSTFTGNKASSTGGAALYFGAGNTIKMDTVTFTTNTATGSGGAIYASGSANTITIDSATFTNNTSSSAGGGIRGGASTTLTVTNSSFSGNTSSGTGGGAAYFGGTASVSISGTTLQNNTASSAGAGVYVSSGSITFNNAVLHNNKSASTAGALYTSSTTTVNIDATKFSNNTGTSAGAIYVGSSASTLVIDRSLFTGNTASRGAMYFTLGGSATISNSTFSKNTGSGNGGAIGSWSATLTINNSTFSENRAANGGAIAMISTSSSALLTINNSTIANNTATAGAGGINSASTATLNQITLSSTIVGGNSGTTSNDINTAAGATIGGDHNLVGVASVNWSMPGSPNTVGATTTQIGVVALADNSGFQLLDGSYVQTMALTATSLARDNGLANGNTYDQRGNPHVRTLGADTDIGAFEANAQPVPTVTGAATNVTVSGGTTFDVTVTFKDDLGIKISTIDVNDVVVKTALGGTTLNAASFVATPNSGVSSPVTVVYTFNAPDNGGVGVWDATDTDLYSVWFVGTVTDSDGPDNSVAAPQNLTSFAATLGAKSLVVSATGDVDDGNYTSGNLTLREAVNFSNLNTTNVDSIGFSTTTFNVPSTITLTGVLAIADPTVISGSGVSMTISGNDTTQIFNIAIPSVDSVQMSNLTLTKGRSGLGGAIGMTDDSLTLNNMTFSSNTSTAQGGAIALTTGTLVVQNSSFTNNSSTTTGGAIYGSSTVAITIQNSLFDSNTASGSGGAIWYSAGTLDIDPSQFKNNRGTTGGAIFISAAASTTTIDQSQFTGNTATTGRGGAVYENVAGALVVSNSTFDSNTATSTGGGIQVWSGSTTITNTTISRNRATDGGGIHVNSNSVGQVLNLYNTTISGNTATAAGSAGGLRTTSTITLTTLSSTIIAGNSGVGSADVITAAATSISGDNNLIGVQDATWTASGTGNLIGTSGSPFDAGLNAPADNGGFTLPDGSKILTMSLKASSQAIDAGNNLYGGSEDERGATFPRVINGFADMGAFEAPISPIPKAKLFSAPDITSAGNSDETITIVYTDDVGIDTASLNTNDVVVTGPGLSSATATFTGFTGGGTSVTATYTVNNTWGGWNQGSYAVSMVGSQVFDSDTPTANSVAAGTIGSFKTAISGGSSLVVDEASDVNDGNYNVGKRSLREAVAVANASVGTDTISFSLPSGTTITIGSPLNLTDSVDITGPGANKLAINANKTGRVITTGNGQTYNISGLEIYGGSTTLTGGAMFIGKSSTVTLDGVWLHDNTTTGTGGAIGEDTSESPSLISLTLKNSTISGSTGTYGGAVYFLRGMTLSISNSTLANNKATSAGGAIGGLTTSSGSITIHNSTISGNSGASGAAIRLSNASYSVGVLSLESTIISGNLPTSLSAIYGYSTTASVISTNSLIDRVTAGMVTNVGTSVTGTVGVPVDALLTALGNYGGTMPTMVIKAGSPALDTGSNPDSLTTDQRGFARQSGVSVDMGANEGVNVIPAAVLTTAPNVFAAGASTYSFTVVYSDETGIDTTSIGTGDIQVSGGNFGSPVNASSFAITGNSGTSVTVSYTITPPGGNWDIADNGTYAISMLGSQVNDTDGPNSVPAGSLGTFKVGIGTTYLVDEATDVDDLDYTVGKLSLREAIKLANTAPTDTTDIINFSSTTFGSAVTITVNTVMNITDPVIINGPGAGILTLDGTGKGVRAFGITLGTAGSTVSMSDLTVTNFSVTGSGGAIDNQNAALTLTNMVLKNNTASSNGGAINLGVAGSSLTVFNSVLSSNTATGGDGGAVYEAVSTTVAFTNSAIRDNIAASTSGDGGGIMMSGGGLFTMDNSTLSGNKANNTSTAFGGGGLYANGVITATITNSTVSGNFAAGGGGGLHMDDGTGVLNLRNSTVTNNSSTANGGGINLRVSGGTANIVSSIVAGNTSSALGQDIFGVSGSVVNIDTGNIGNSTDIATLNQTGINLINVNPNLDVLADNGGLLLPDGNRIQTHRLKAGSAAINAGSNTIPLTYDERGSSFARSVGQTDMGAYEVQAPATVTSVVISDGTGVAVTHRSQVRQIIVTFSTPVNFTGSVASAFTVHRTGNSALNGNPIGDVSLLASPVSGPASTVTITFNNADTTFVESGGTVAQPLGSLIDGLYNFTIDASKISTVDGALDGDGVGGFGGNYAVVGTTGNGFYRFFGDSNGDGLVNQTDYNAFRLAFLGGPNNIFDFDGGAVGQVSQPDYNAFRLRFLGTP